MKVTLDTQEIIKWFSAPFKKNVFWQYIAGNLDMIASITVTVAAFLYIFGLRVLNVFDTDFVVMGGDFTVSYLGSVFYRLDEWRWPLLTHLNLAYPYGISVHGTDGSPLLSLIFKVFHKFFGLPADVQFVGVWMLICYVLQSVFSVLIFRKAFKNQFLIFIASLFFISAPIMLMRVFVHINLMCHFILLWAILLWMNNKLTRSTWIAMGILITLATLTCPYFLPMIGGFFGILIIQQVFVEKQVSYKKAIIGIISLGLVFAFWFLLLGMVEKEQVLTSGGWRGLSLNLTALFNPIWSESQVFEKLTPKADFDADNYFGFGLLILLALMFPHVKHLFKHENLKKNALISLLLLGFTLFALSSQIKFGTTVVLDYNPGEFVNWIGSVFRYSGRFFWPIWYLLAFFIIARVAKSFPKAVFVLLPVLLAIQIWDLYPNYVKKHDFAATTFKPKNFVSEEWKRLDRDYKNIFIFAHNENYKDMWRWAIKHNKNVNYGFLNRPSSKTQKLVNDTREAILAGSVPYKDYFYLIDGDLMKKIEDTAKINPDVMRLKSLIKNIDGFDILEYSEELAKTQKEFQKKEILVKHRYWDDKVIQISSYRVYRDVEGKFIDYATILRFDEEALDLKWDKYGEENFVKQSDGKYHQVIKDKK
ncbi:MAG: hypothetical protein IJY58_00790 [Alphaproteobacteria bacterium]|nr:hypothetical protein [Alphaproteobacteria bacterium]